MAWRLLVTVPMSATRYRDGCLSVFLLAGLLAIAPRSDAAWAAVAGSHAGGHVGGFRGGGRLGMDVPRGGEFGAASLAGAPVTSVSPTGATADEASSRTSTIIPTTTRAWITGTTPTSRATRTPAATRTAATAT